MSEAPSHRLTRAIIVGGSFAGMLAAAAVKDHFDAVDIIEAHEVPSGPGARVGVPQAAHLHILLSGGAHAVDELLPGSIDQLLAAGANRVPMTTNMVVYSPEGWYRRWQRDTHYLIAASRNLTDYVIREQVLKDPRVTVRARTRATSLLGDRHRVTGVHLRTADGSETNLTADLVIDASGRSATTPQWLADLGIRDLAEERINSGLVYASRVYQAPVSTRDWPVINVSADPRTGGRAGGILPIEGDRWHVSLCGPPGSQPTRDARAFEDYANTLRDPIVAQLLAHAKPLCDVTVTHSTANRRFYFERLKAWPEGLIVLGDSVAAFNPIYGHGMSVAAQGALAVRRLLSTGRAGDFARLAQRAIARPVNVAWSLAIGQDVHFPTTEGKRPNLADQLLRRYVSRLSRTATGSFRTATALTDVLTLQAPPVTLVRPDVLLASVFGPLRPQLDRPTFTEAERQRMSDVGISLSPTRT